MEEENVRFIQQLKIRIGEGKNLQPKSGSNWLKDCFCVIRLDREEIFRTQCSNEKTLNPFFGEEFYFDIPRLFRFLSIYLYEREKTVNTIRNRPIGKVTIRRSQLVRFPSDELWFPLLPANYDSEIEGKINLLIEPKYIFKTNSLAIIVNVYECQDLSPDCCDSHVVINLKLSDNKVLNRRSKVKKRTSHPQYNESFYFEIPLSKYCFDNSECQYMCHRLLATSELTIFVKHDSCGRSGNAFLGEVRIPLSKYELNESHKAWYYLQPKSIVTKSGPNLGSLRLRLDYISDYVFSSQRYDSFRKLLLLSPEVRPITSSVAFLLGEFILNKADAAQPLIKIFLYYNKLVPLIRFLAQYEILKVTDVNTIFRGNSLASKCIDELMKLVGKRYLHDTLKKSVEMIILEQKQCEIDPNRINQVNDSLESNMNNLKRYISDVYFAIIQSTSRCPPIMCQVFNVLKELAIDSFPNNKEVNYYVISGFVFLRFFVPAILNPRLFELTDLQINTQTNRTFTLISKTIQSIGNLVVSKKNTPLIKENYMISLYKDFINDEHIIKTKKFLEMISSCQIRISKDVPLEPIILKESIMYKKSKYKRIGFGTTFKKRYFCLTTQYFSYSKAKNKIPLLKLPIEEITVNRDGCQIKNTFQIVHSKCTLHIQAMNCVQEKEWLDILTRIIEFNHQSQSSINNRNNFLTNGSLIVPSNYNGEGSSSSNGGGGDSSHSSIAPDLSIHIDPDRELERIHRLFVANQSNMDSIIEACELGLNSVKIYKGHGKVHPSQFMIEDEQCTILPTLMQLKDCVTQLEHCHQRYLESIHGTECSPIEVDSYTNGSLV